MFLSIKIRFLELMINLCNSGLKYSEGADSQEDINTVIKTKNYFIRERDRLLKPNEGMMG